MSLKDILVSFADLLGIIVMVFALAAAVTLGIKAAVALWKLL